MLFRSVSQSRYYRTDKKEKKVSARFIQEEDDLQTLIDDLDEVTSRMIRFKYADKEGFVECFTCDAKQTIANTQCGHFIPRLHMATRFLTFNLIYISHINQHKIEHTLSKQHTLSLHSIYLPKGLIYQY